MKKIIYLIITITILFSLTACKHKHRLVSFEEKAPTCTENGTKKYWYCTECINYFTDEKGTQSINYEELIISKKDHLDENTDHICDSDCGETNIGIHEDKNKDHVCDYGCSETIGIHDDSNIDNDHVCDYGCGVTLEDCHGSNATCVSKAECEACGNGYGDFLEHSYKYVADFHTVNETCTNGCNHSETLTLNVPNAVYTGNPVPIEVVCTPNFKGSYTLTYNTDDSLAPTDAGIWEFTLTVGDVTITDSYEVKVILDNISLNNIDFAFDDNYWINEEHTPGVSYYGNIQDVGKTAWEEEDQIIVTLTSQSYGSKSYTLTYKSGIWTTDGDFAYSEGEIPTISAVYAPCYEVVEGEMQLKDGMKLGMTEYIEADCDIDYNTGTINISFPEHKNYSRIRIIGESGATYTVNTIKFTPVGSSMMNGDLSFTLTADKYGNMYLYGIFAEDSIINIPKGEITLESQVFYEATEVGKSYVVDARVFIDGTLDYKETATEDDITALVEKLKLYVDNGITTIIVTGETPAMIDMSWYTNTAIGEAIYRLSGSGTHNADNLYNGMIDLILPDVTEIIGYEHQNAYALNSITLPKVTTVGENAFEGCWYLQELTFGSVVTLIKNELAFRRVGESVDGGCNLVLNRGQASAAAEYQPDIMIDYWWNTPWKSITLI